MKRHWICEKIVVGTLLSVAVGSVHGELLVYEPFDYLPDEILTGQGGALGTVGLWNTFDTITGDGKTQDWFVHAEGTTSGVGLSSANPSAEPSGMHRWDGTVANPPAATLVSGARMTGTIPMGRIPVSPAAICLATLGSIPA